MASLCPIVRQNERLLLREECTPSLTIANDTDEPLFVKILTSSSCAANLRLSKALLTLRPGKQERIVIAYTPPMADHAPRLQFQAFVLGDRDELLDCSNIETLRAQWEEREWTARQNHCFSEEVLALAVVEEASQLVRLDRQNEHLEQAR